MLPPSTLGSPRVAHAPVPLPRVDNHNYVPPGTVGYFKTFPAVQTAHDKPAAAAAAAAAEDESALWSSVGPSGKHRHAAPPSPLGAVVREPAARAIKTKSVHVGAQQSVDQPQPADKKPTMGAYRVPKVLRVAAAAAASKDGLVTPRASTPDRGSSNPSRMTNTLNLAVDDEGDDSLIFKEGDSRAGDNRDPTKAPVKSAAAVKPAHAAAAAAAAAPTVKPAPAAAAKVPKATSGAAASSAGAAPVAAAAPIAVAASTKAKAKVKAKPVGTATSSVATLHGATGASSSSVPGAPGASGTLNAVKPASTRRDGAGPMAPARSSGVTASVGHTGTGAAVEATAGKQAFGGKKRAVDVIQLSSTDDDGAAAPRQPVKKKKKAKRTSHSASVGSAATPAAVKPPKQAKVDEMFKAAGAARSTTTRPATMRDDSAVASKGGRRPAAGKSSLASPAQPSSSAKGARPSGFLGVVNLDDDDDEMFWDLIGNAHTSFKSSSSSAPISARLKQDLSFPPSARSSLGHPERIVRSGASLEPGAVANGDRPIHPSLAASSSSSSSRTRDRAAPGEFVISGAREDERDDAMDVDVDPSPDERMMFDSNDDEDATLTRTISKKEKGKARAIESPEPEPDVSFKDSAYLGAQDDGELDDDLYDNVDDGDEFVDALEEIEALEAVAQDDDALAFFDASEDGFDGDETDEDEDESLDELESDEETAEPRRPTAGSSAQGRRDNKRSSGREGRQKGKGKRKEKTAKVYKPVGGTREGQRDPVVVMKSYAPTDDALAARPEDVRVDFASRVRNAVTDSVPIDFLCASLSPSQTIRLQKSHAAAAAVAAKIESEFAQNRADPCRARVERPADPAEACSPTGYQVANALFDAVKNSRARSALKSFLASVPLRLARLGPTDPAETGQEDAFRVLEDEVEKVAKEYGAEDMLSKLKNRLVPPSGSVADPIGHMSNYPPLTALTDDHKSGVNPATWTGERLVEKHGLEQHYFSDFQGFAAQTNQGGVTLERNTRTMPDDELDGPDGGGMGMRVAVHRAAWDLGLVTFKERAQLGTITVVTGPQAGSSVEHVAAALAAEGWIVETRDVVVEAIFGVSNNFATFADGSSSFRMVLIYKEEKNDIIIGSLNLLTAQWCSGVASSFYCHSASAFRKMAVLDAVEDLLHVVKTGESNSSAARSNLAQSTVPHKLTGMQPSTARTLRERASLRRLEIDLGVVFTVGEIPVYILNMAIRQKDLSRLPPPECVDINGKTPLQFMISASSGRAMRTMADQTFVVQGKVLNGLEYKAHLAHETLANKLVLRDGKLISGTSDRNYSGAETLRNTIVTVDGEEMTGLQARGKKSKDTNENILVYDSDEDDFLTGPQARGKVAKATKASRKSNIVTQKDGRDLPRYTAAATQAVRTRGDTDWGGVAVFVWSIKHNYLGNDDLDWPRVADHLVALGKVDAKFAVGGKNGLRRQLTRHCRVQFGKLYGEDWRESL